MPTQTKPLNQGLLFDIPSIAETGVWCTLNPGIDPAQWAGLCRKIGQLSPNRFAEIADFLENQPKSSHYPKNCNLKSALYKSPDSLLSRLKRVFSFTQAEVAHLPLVSIGPEGLNI